MLAFGGAITQARMALMLGEHVGKLLRITWKKITHEISNIYNCFLTIMLGRCWVFQLIHVFFWLDHGTRMCFELDRAIPWRQGHTHRQRLSLAVCPKGALCCYDGRDGRWDTTLWIDPIEWSRLLRQVQSGRIAAKMFKSKKRRILQGWKAKW